jgi:hypothetical protein
MAVSARQTVLILSDNRSKTNFLGKTENSTMATATNIYLVRFKVLTVTSRKDILLDVPQCSLIETDGRFGGAYCLHHRGDGYQ